MKGLFLGCLSTLLASASLVLAKGVRRGQIKNFVPFGDSYTDIVLAGDNGAAWPIYVADYANVTLIPEAHAGATCSNALTFRPFPPVTESQLPTFFEQLSNGSLPEVAKHQDETVYTLWIGTNDLGVSSIITGQQTPGVTVVNTTTCTLDWIKSLYAKGGRNFILQNVSSTLSYPSTQS